jgi:DNA (cytosine-5)-methyltransferase 1
VYVLYTDSLPLGTLMPATRKRKGTDRPSAFDLFSGCGGLTVGLKRAGFSVLAAVETWDAACEAYAANHPNVHLVHEDIAVVDPVRLMRALDLRAGQLDLLAGCPPCQGFSSLRTLNGTRPVTDQRNDLIFEFVRFAIALLPKTILLENVPALESDERLVRVKSILKAAGYSCAARVLDAADFGVPQRRRRLLFLGSRIGEVSFPSPATRRVTVRAAIAGLPTPGKSGDELHDSVADHSPRVAEMIKMIPRDGGSRADLGQNSQLACHQRLEGFHDVYGRMRWDDVSPTITSGCINPSKGRFLHPDQNRAISLREASLLQGFPRRYKLPLARGRYPVAELIGNAFPPEFVRRQAVQLKRLLQNAAG